MKVEVSCDGAPPDLDDPLPCNQLYFLSNRNGKAHTCEFPHANLLVPSAQPVRQPGPAILLKLPLLTAFPNPSAPSLSVPPSSVQSTSTIRGRWACFMLD